MPARPKWIVHRRSPIELSGCRNRPGELVPAFPAVMQGCLCSE